MKGIDVKTVKHNSRIDEKKRVYWSSKLKAWQSSGLSAPKFCKQQNLSIHVFKYWKQKLSKVFEKSTLVPVSIIPNKSLSQHKQSLSVLGSQGSGLSIHVDNRLQISIDADFNPKTLIKLVKTLESL